jgi:hypothetical protein
MKTTTKMTNTNQTHDEENDATIANEPTSTHLMTALDPSPHSSPQQKTINHLV